MLLGYRPIQHVTVLNTIGNCSTIVFIYLNRIGTVEVVQVHPQALKIQEEGCDGRCLKGTVEWGREKGRDKGKEGEWKGAHRSWDPKR